MFDFFLLFVLDRAIIIDFLKSTPCVCVSEQNYDRIKSDMHINKVESILGGPPGDYRTGPTVSCLPGYSSFDVEDNTLRNMCWQGDNACIEIWIDPKGLVKYTRYKLMAPKPLSEFKKFLWRCDRWRKSIITQRRKREEKSAM